MDLIYTREDLKSLFEYVKSNPKCKLKDWDKHSESNLTKEEKKLLKHVEVCELQIPNGELKHNFHIIRWNHHGHNWEILNRFAFKIFKEFWQFEVTNNSYWDNTIILTKDEEFFNVDNWQEGEIRMSKQIKNNASDTEIVFSVLPEESVSTLDEEEVDDIYSDYGGWCNIMERHYKYYYCGDFSLFIKNLSKLKFKPALQVWKNNSLT